MTKYGKALLALIVFDAFLTAWLLRSGHAHEFNPLMRLPYEIGGIPLFLACKLVWQIGLVAVLEILHPHNNNPRFYRFAATGYGIILIATTAVVNLK